MRRMAKTVNFGVLYGMAPWPGGAAIHPREEAARFIDAYFARYPKVQEYQAKLLESCRRHGYVSTILGRRREITGLRSDSTYQQRNQPEREAINMEIQGSAADLIKMAMLNIYRRLRRERLQRGCCCRFTTSWFLKCRRGSGRARGAGESRDDDAFGTGFAAGSPARGGDRGRSQLAGCGRGGKW